MAAFARFLDLKPLLEDDDVDVERVVGLLALASDSVRADVGQMLDYVQNDTATVSFRDGVLILPELPVVDVASVVVDGVPVAAKWSPAGVVTVPGVLSGPAVVTYTHGYPVIPPAVRRVTLGVAKRAYENPSQYQQESGPGASISYGPSQGRSVLGLTEDEQRDLDPFRP